MIDLRSDTVTRPNQAMRAAMATAEVGDDGYGADPTVNALEARAAAMLGKEAGLYVPSGTMGNLVALLTHTTRWDEAYVEATSHIYRTEVGGIASLAGLPHRVMPGTRGMIDLGQLETAIAESRLHPALLCLETTHNAAGGVVLPLDYLAAAQAVAQKHGMILHIDGARVFNAAVALGVPVERIARHCDTITFCLSKGLGAPVGSVLCGPAEFIRRARASRRLVGGAMRQSGIVAAAGLVALDTMIERLAEDHRRAKTLAEGLAAIHPGLVDPAQVETNILYLDLTPSGVAPAEWSRRLGDHGITCRPYNSSKMRLLTHCDVDDAGIEQTVNAFRALWPNTETRAA